MTKIEWGAPGAKQYETGLDRGVLYPFNNAGVVDPGVPWNGLVSVTENVSGGEIESFWYDGVKYLDVILYEDFQATIEAFNAPPEFGVCDGSQQVALGLFATQQPRRPFHLCYRTGVGNDISEDASTKLHLIYNNMAQPTEKLRKTRSNAPEMPTYSWVIHGCPAAAGVYGGDTYKPTAHLILDLGVIEAAHPGYVDQIEDLLYGSVGEDPYFPTQQEVVTFLNTGSWT